MVQRKVQTSRDSVVVKPSPVPKRLLWKIWCLRVRCRHEEFIPGRVTDKHTTIQPNCKASNGIVQRIALCGSV